MRNREKAIAVLRPVSGVLLMASVLSILTLVLSSLRESPQDFGKLFLQSLYFIVPYVVSWFAVRYIKNLAVYVLVSAVPILVILILPYPALLKAVLVLVCGILVAARASARMRGGRDFTEKPSAVVLGLFIAAFFIGGGFENELMSTINYYLAFAYAIVFIIYSNFKKLNEYLEFNKNVENIPYSQISRTNYGTLAIYLLLTIALMIILPLLGIDKLAANLGQALKDLLSKIIGDPDYSTASHASMETDPSYEMVMPEGIARETETPQWLKILYQIFSWVATGAVIIIGLGILVMVSLRMMKLFYRSEKSGIDKDEFIHVGDETKESLFREFKPVKRVQEWLDRSPNAQVRRFYKKTLLKNAKNPPEAYMTPEEAETYAGLPEGKNRETLHTLYEKARYSASGVSREELRMLKE
ncbi:MAG: hypothetical protein IJL98_09365 [Lachnospiraceae bacterium]|nr:hypothetical protein [Lachnospiraceae bacterium]